MPKLSFPRSASFKDLPLAELNDARFPVYVLDKQWNYLFVNRFVMQNLGSKAQPLEGLNMWTVFPELNKDFAFKALKEYSENGIDSDLVTLSPLTAQKIYISGRPLQDCFFFTTSIMPNKEEIIEDLRAALPGNKARGAN